MSTAVNHRKRSYRSERRAAAYRSRPNRVIRPYGAVFPTRNWMRSLFRKVGRQERAAERPEIIGEEAEA